MTTRPETKVQNAATGGKNQDRTRNSVLRQMALLQSMSLEQLREKWLGLYGEEPPQYKKQFLIKCLAYRIQELFYGGLSERGRIHIGQVAKGDNDRRYEVTVQAEGYEFDARTFRSLSAVAREITGTRWNGKVFSG
jgi:hypothetical protein